MNPFKAALIQIANFADIDASEHMRKTGSYGQFDEPSSVKIAREALRDAGQTPVHQDEAFAAISDERLYQDTRWPSMQQARIGEEILLLEQLLSEARILWSREKYPELGALNMMRKIAAVAVRCMENHGVLPRKLT